MSEFTLSTLDDKIKLNNMVDEVVQALQRISDTQSFIKDVCERAVDELGAPKSLVAQLAKERHTESASNKLFKIQEIIELNEELTSVKIRASK